MAIDLHAETEDMAQLMELLKEYTEKLRTICNELLKDKWRLFMILTSCIFGIVVVCVWIVIVLMTWSEALKSTFVVSILVGTLISFVTTPVTILILARFAYGNEKRGFDAQHFVQAVTRMVASASQYSEHASHRIGDKFTFDLRVAEAESVLAMYKSITRS